MRLNQSEPGSYVIVLLTLAVFCLPFIQCKKKSVSEPEVGSGSKNVLEVYQILESSKSKFLELAAINNGDPKLSMVQLKDWVLGLPEVEAADHFDSVYLRIAMKSGLFTNFNLKLVNDNGDLLYRGAGSGAGNNSGLFAYGKKSRSLSSVTAGKEIKNKKVLFFAPAYTEFGYNTNGRIEKLSKRFKDKDKEFDIRVLKDKECTVGTISSFGLYGLVIMDTHGLPDGFLIGTSIDFITIPKDEKEMSNMIIEQTGQWMLDMLNDGRVGVSGQISVNTGKPDWYLNTSTFKYTLFASSKLIETMPVWDNTIVFGNMCYSGTTNYQKPSLFKNTPIATAFSNRGLISYYGYAFNDGWSTVVEDGFAKAMEDSMIQSFVNYSDSTGNVHLNKSTQNEYMDQLIYNYYKKSLYLKHFGEDNYSYHLCGSVFTDKRDGQKYKTICVAEVPYKQVWMAQNLNYNVAGSYHYNNNSANGQVYGRLYTWNAVMAGAAATEKFPSGVQGICPDGWHVPSYQEWANMIYYLGGNSVAGGKLKSLTLWNSPNLGAVDSVGFTSLPSGYFNGVEFKAIGEQASFWITNPSNLDPGYAGYMSLNYNSTGIFKSEGSKDFGFACRCVKNY